MTDDRQIWRGWEWPWKNKERSPEKALIGLGQIHDRLMRKYVWVYQGPEKYKPILHSRTGKSKTLTGKLHR